MARGILLDGILLLRTLARIVGSLVQDEGVPDLHLRLFSGCPLLIAVPVYAANGLVRQQRKEVAMPFPESVKDAAFTRSGGRCECARKEDSHSQGRCATALTRKSAEFHHKTAAMLVGPTLWITAKCCASRVTETCISTHSSTTDGTNCLPHRASQIGDRWAGRR